MFIEAGQIAHIGRLDIYTVLIIIHYNLGSVRNAT
jgi:hypothetical protein